MELHCVHVLRFSCEGSVAAHRSQKGAPYNGITTPAGYEPPSGL